MRSNLTTSRLALAVVLLLALGACSAQEPEIVINEQVPADQAVAEGGEEEGGEAAEELGEPDAVWVAEQLAFTDVPASMPADDAVIALEIIGGVPHNVVFEGFDGDAILVEGNAEGVYTDQVSVPAGDYTYYCSIAGHRAAGMEGTITVG